MKNVNAKKTTGHTIANAAHSRLALVPDSKTNVEKIRDGVTRAFAEEVEEALARASNAFVRMHGLARGDGSWPGEVMDVANQFADSMHDVRKILSGHPFEVDELIEAVNREVAR